MTYKSAAEIFGDGGGFGPAVPYSTSNPPGTSAGNRGVQFGEQLTAAIANRTHYALALNTDDLNARLASFETNGLDAAYDGGTVGPAGAGRIVIKDAGAIETHSAIASAFGDTVRDHAHFRARANGDTVAASVGYEFRGKRTASNGQSGDDPIAGFMDLKAFAQATGSTQLVVSQAGTVNPGGALPTTLRTGAGKFGTSGTTDLIQGLDLVEITGTAGSDGLYVFNILGSTDADAILLKLDGTSPAFVSGEACVLTVYRTTWATWGSFGSRSTNAHGVAIGGVPLILIPGSLSTPSSPTQEGGSGVGLSVKKKVAGGQVSSAFTVDAFGRLKYVLARGDFFDEISKNVDGGAYASIKDHSADGSVGHILRTTGVTTVEHPSFMDLHMVQRTDLTPNLSPSITVLTFTANSATQGEVGFNVAQDANLPNYIQGGAMLMEIQSGPTGTDGMYAVLGWSYGPTNGGFYVRKLDGSLPAHFPTTGTFSGRLFAMSVIGWKHAHPNGQPVDPAATQANYTANNSLSAGLEADGTALALHATAGLGSEQRYLLRGFKTTPLVSDGTQEVIGVRSDGNMFLAGDLTLTVGSHDYKYSAAHTYDQSIVPATATRAGAGFTSTSPVINTADPELYFISGNGDYIVKGVDEVSGQLGLIWPLKLPQGAIIVSLIMRYTSVAGSGPVPDDIRTTIVSKTSSTLLSLKTGSPNYFAMSIDGATHNTTFTMTESSGNRTVDNTTKEYFVWVGRPTGLGDYGIIILDIRVAYTITTVAGA